MKGKALHIPRACDKILFAYGLEEWVNSHSFYAIREVIMEKLHEIIKETVEALGYYLYQSTFQKRGGDYILEVEIDHKNPISIDDCVSVSEQLSKTLDEIDPIEQPYMLEVSSAGAEHPLRNDEEIQRAIGKFIHLKKHDQTVIEGTLVSANETSIDVLIKKENTTQTIPKTDIEKIRLAVDF